MSLVRGVDTAIEQNMEGELRYNHSRIIAHSEEIAFYRGGEREKQIANATFNRVLPVRVCILLIVLIVLGVL